MGLGRSVAVAVLLLAARMAVGGGFLEGAPVERRIELSGIDTIDIDAAHFTVEVLGDPDLNTVTVVSRMSTRFHRLPRRARRGRAERRRCFPLGPL